MQHPISVVVATAMQRVWSFFNHFKDMSEILALGTW